MDIIRFMGGLGNQMFQYAFAEALRARGRRVRCNRGYYKKPGHSGEYSLSSVFKNVFLDEIGDEQFDFIERKWENMKGKSGPNAFLRHESDCFFWIEDAEEEGRYTPSVFDTDECTFVGFWQTYKYFYDIRNGMRDVFAFKEDTGDLKRFRALLGNGANYVSIHVRRGDYLKCADIFGNICTENYYDSAINFFIKQQRTPVFVFFSDDIEWVKQTMMVKDAIYVSREDFSDYQSWYDMYFMTLCQSNIIANSTYSWWGAWFNRNSNKTVVAPSKWSNTRAMPDICPPEWIRI